MLALRLAARPALRSARRLQARRQTLAMAKPIIHFDSTTCPYAQRSWIALIEKGLDFEVRKVDLQNKDKEFVETYHSINPNPEAPAKVPILIDGPVRLVESAVIVDYLNAAYPQPPLLPADAGAAAKARLFAELFSSQVGPLFYAILRADSKQAVAEGKAKLAAGLKVLDAFLRLHGSEEGGDYFLGGTYSMAEMLCTGFLQRGAACLPHYRGIDLWAMVQEAGLDRMERWMRAALARPSAQATKPSDEVIISSTAKFVTPLKE